MKKNKGLAYELNKFIRETIPCLFCQHVASNYIVLTGDSKVKELKRKMNEKEFSKIIQDGIGLAYDVHTMSFRDHAAISSVLKKKDKLSEEEFLMKLEESWNTPANKLKKK